ncbi:NADP-dependent oxidoreductase [Mechercharimyces sp. CAU 1602]|uniref:NADP-dependent oxidoreductase n=1 Tax=Mechercharimyces sp. CAU 1602 TaxID=2973933 RepID=UPI002161788A|nr:NADP-dependent oxidoreductase [Mechercharimyces sp. CAU 1602]MCS1350391.1 NADP-dependent oxidoreductase [Mechercharimyces sp. CAU 1602]
MKAMTVEKYGADQQLQLTELPTPSIGDDDVLVRISAASVNPIDYLVRNGNFRLAFKNTFPLILGNDMAGIVEKIGPNVSKFKVGDKVYGRPNPNRIGTFAQYIAIHQHDLALTPQNLTMEEAAAIPLVGLTAWQALNDILQLKKGQKILIHAGAGGVGTFAIQLAKHIGAFVATTASENGEALVKEMGADLFINYKTESFEDVIDHYDAVFDTVGGDTLERSFRVLKPDGKLVSVSGPPTKEGAIAYGLGFLPKMLFSLASKKIRKTAKQYGIPYHWLGMKPNGEQLSQITALIEGGIIRPVIDRTYPLSQAQAAIEHVESKRAKGKVIITVETS